MSDFSAHAANVAALQRHGIEPPREWIAQLARWQSYAALERPLCARLAAEMTNPGSSVDIELLRASALAEWVATSTDTAGVNAPVAAAVHGRLVELYAPVAGRNYKTIAKEFDRLSDDFAAAARIIDPESHSDVVLRHGEAARAAWFSAVESAEKLTELLPILAAAAEIAGGPSGLSRLTEEHEGARLALVADVGKIHRRRVWGAWNTLAGRCGRWSALLAAGADIHAHRSPSKMVAYDRPRPMESFYRPGKFGGYDRVVVDPEDNPGAKVSVGDADWSI